MGSTPLAEQFEYCVHGLNRVKSEHAMSPSAPQPKSYLEALREEQYQLWKKNLFDV